MPGYKCPFCNQYMSVDSSTATVWRPNFNYSNARENDPHMEVNIFRCPNCSKESVIVAGQNGYIGDQVLLVYPSSPAISFPSYIPAPILQDYQEACAVLSRSPKASATLSRRCLQGMIRDFWGITDKKNLYEEINAIQSKVPAAQWAAIDSLRKLGNIGAHMEKDANAILDVDPDEARLLLDLIELLLEKWYVNRHDEEALYKSITDAQAAKVPHKPG